MDLQIWALYASVATLVIVLPGPAALLCVNHGLRYGGRRALATVLGGTFSALVLMGLSAIGVWRLVEAMPAGFQLARLGGALCLVLLGIGTWRAVSGQPRDTPDADLLLPVHKSPLALCRDGFLLGISNPKDLLFFGALLPQFLVPSAPQLPQLACMFLTWALIDGLAMGSYAALGQRLLRWLTSPRHTSMFQRSSGAVLIASGLALGITQPSFVATVS